MSPVRLAIILTVCFLVPVAAGAADGSLHLYLQPFPPAAARLTFTLTSVSAVSATGAEIPLTLGLKSAAPAELRRQRLLASGRLPSGSYAGFVFRTGKATLKGEQGDIALAVADTPTRLDCPFTIGGRQAPIFWLTLRYEDAVTDGFSFNPAFSAVAPTIPIGGYAGFVSNSASNTITVFDKHITQAAAIIDACAGPAGMAIDQLRRRLYVACPKDDEILSIDIATLTVIDRARVSPGDRPREVALTPDGSTLVSVNGGSNSVSFLDAASLTRRERINVDNGPGSIAIDPSGRRAFVFNTLAGTISVVDIESRSLAATISSDAAPIKGQFNRRGDRLYVIHERSPFLTVLDPKQLTIVTKVRLRTGAAGIRVDSVRDLLCISSGSDTAIDFYDPNALMPLFIMRTRAVVSHLTIDAVDNTLYMVSPSTRSLIVGRLTDRKVVSEIDVGDGPSWVAVMGER